MLLRSIRLFLHIAEAALTILLLFVFLDQRQRERWLVFWSARLIRIVGLRTRVKGAATTSVDGRLVVANHSSWLDIHVLHSCLPMRFISKSEVRDWPLFGLMAEKNGTLFLQRSSKRDAARMNQTMVDLLQRGECLALFPEGTTTDGTHVLPFFASLLQPAIDAGAWIQPVCIRYLDADGRPSLAAAYHGETSLLDSLKCVLAEPEIRVEVHFLPPVAAGGRPRRALAAELETAIRSTLAGGGPGNPPGTVAHLPA